MPLVRASHNLPLRVTQLVVAVALASSIFCPCALSESFDQPIRKTVINLGRSAYLMPNSPSRVELSCSYYAAFMAKELDDPGMKGTRWVTITPIQDGHIPKCRVSHSSTEKFIAKEWWTFIGAKGSLLFLEAADGDDNQGMPFRVLELKTGEKIFEDSAWDSNLTFSRTPDGKISLGYLRVVGGDCSIPKGGGSCWNGLREKFGLPPAAAPKCANYLGEQTLTAQDAQSHSVIAYPVAVGLFPRPSIKVVPGPVKCRQE
jgi:hypothetical protein